MLRGRPRGLRALDQANFGVLSYANLARHQAFAGDAAGINPVAPVPYVPGLERALPLSCGRARHPIWRPDV
jgi:hypothetical protein